MKIESEGLTFMNLFLSIGSFGFIFIGIIASWRFKKIKEPLPQSRRSLIVEFKDKSIEFPSGYYFKYSSLAINKSIESSVINEVNLMTCPPSVVINDNEVIFLDYKHKEELERFANENDLKIADRYDIWEHLNEPFLDTEFTEKEKDLTIRNLVNNGLTELEITNIRRKLKWIMWQYTLGMEWAYLGQFDYLRLTFLTKRKYWWTMKIALKNYKKGK